MAGTATALAAPQPSQFEPRKDTLIFNVNGADYREADGTIVVRLVASNSTTRDAVIVTAQLVHTSLSAGGFSLGYKQTGRLPRFKELVGGGGKAQVFEVVSEVDLRDFYSDDLVAENLPEDSGRSG